jgi:2-polyprenyl-6-methoxyphenol hydroxylase-like FAD-dependent oxidoreductase
VETADVLVVGGGIGGLAAALALRQRGWGVTVLEAGGEPPADRWGLTLWPPGVRVLDALGVGGDVRRRGTVIERLSWLRGDGKELLGVSTEEIASGGQFVGALPSVVIRALAQAAERAGVRLARGWRVRSCARIAGSADLRAASEDGNERSFAARLVVVADGANSITRRLVGLGCFRFRIPGQQVFTGIGGSLPFRELRQAVGTGWSISAVPMGEGASWFAVVLPRRWDGQSVLRGYAREGDCQLATAVAALARGFSVAPVTGYSPRWAVDGVVLMGEAAHPMLPHLGLGGSMTLADVPTLAEMVDDALRSGDTSSRVLGRLRQLRRREVGYAQRISLLWALTSPGSNFLLRRLRDLDFLLLGRSPQRMSRFLQELVEHGVPPLLCRAAVWLP